VDDPSQVFEPNVVEATLVASSVAFGDFFAAEQHGLFTALCLVVGDRSEAEDITQDAMVKVFGKWHKVAVMDDPHGYLYRTAMNIVRSRYRRAMVAARRTVLPASAGDPTPGFDLHLDLARALSSLSRQQRAAVVLTDLLGFSSDEAGVMLAISPSTVRVHVTRARAALKDVIDRG
jgi:RNA polymerase sigma factor (sigma-70 family)